MIVARHVTEPFDDGVWARCQPVTIEHYWSGEPAPASRHAEVRICWSDQALYVRYVCEQHEPLVVSENPRTDVKTLGLWDRDVCEIFLAPDVDHRERYFEFEAAPSGEWVDLGIVITPSGRNTDWDYRSGMTTTAELLPEQLIIQITIPWSDSIPKPEK